MRTAINLIAV
ncbi:hypothetical protein D030_4719A, partial [Vibrio parahaemolyticus AQ3810]